MNFEQILEIQKQLKSITDLQTILKTVLFDASIHYVIELIKADNIVEPVELIYKTEINKLDENREFKSNIFELLNCELGFQDEWYLNIGSIIENVGVMFEEEFNLVE